MKLTQTFAFEVPMVNIDPDSAPPEHANVVLDRDEARELWLALDNVFGDSRQAPVMPLGDHMLTEDDEVPDLSQPAGPRRSMSPDEAAAWLQIQEGVGHGTGAVGAGSTDMPAGFVGGSQIRGGRASAIGSRST